MSRIFYPLGEMIKNFRPHGYISGCGASHYPYRARGKRRIGGPLKGCLLYYQFKVYLAIKLRSYLKGNLYNLHSFYEEIDNWSFLSIGKLDSSLKNHQGYYKYKLICLRCFSNSLGWKIFLVSNILCQNIQSFQLGFWT